ncbi:guanylyl cyclase 1 isoform X2 [Rhodamnia argentea]|uniref:Guanylyl cyclase 1 isoform X2 n=1 Tax=Rhodamnia argentea TaxID=178133 RepID=A0ABM3HU76_9MYRT|nr:guanylyl cyclase 1 isoform X2 [Rhodamnia argentea]XP_048140152.1 guanylyl cyclase 1 isoform X2 [Rhodamnia argentea]XP_048140153.1 guanylyl cyclase 1 isoform X2 [Rhodamnia argentea]
MWPLYLLLNKILKAEEDEDSVEVQKSVEGHPSSVDDGCYKEALPRAQFIEVPHVNQLSSWDCGLACISMVLRTIGIKTCSVDTLADLCCTNSIWTVDLAYLLQKFSVKFSYYTVTLGANPGYSDEFYYKEQLPTDVVRVNKLFHEAIEAGISIQCRSINEEQISLLILSGKYVAIALVDQHKLSRSWLDGICASGLGDSESGYTGHYIVICGYDADKDEFEIRDPASSRKQEKVTSSCLGEARKSFGTDEDILLVTNQFCCAFLHFEYAWNRARSAIALQKNYILLITMAVLDTGV